MDAIHQLSIPTPFTIGHVNCYVLTCGDRVTLVDPGPMTDVAYVALLDQLERNEYAIDDIDTILIIHEYIDHAGVAQRVADESGAWVYAHGNAAERLEDPVSFFERERAFFEPFLLSMGLPEAVVDTVAGLPDSYLNLQRPTTIDRYLTDGDRLDSGCELVVLHTPGPTPGSVCFVAPNDDVAFVWDHVMNDISPNPMLTLAPDTTTERTRNLPAYLTSLQNLREIGMTIGYGGHRETIRNLGHRITEVVDHHQRRKDRIAGVLAERGPLSAYAMMNVLFPELPAEELFPGMSEVIGHLDLLEDEGGVDVRTIDGVERYELC